MDDATKNDILRELEKLEDTLGYAELYFQYTSEANAALHCNPKVFYSPLSGQVSAGLKSIELIRARVGA